MPIKLPKDSFFDGFLDLSGGVNSGWEPGLIPNNTLAYAVNCTVRGGFVTHRPALGRLPLSFLDSVVQKRVVNGKFQGGAWYQPDDGDPYLLASISGRLFTFSISDSEQSDVREVTPSATTLTTLAFIVPAYGADGAVQVQSTKNISTSAPIQIGSGNYTVTSVDSDTDLTVNNTDAPPGDSIPAGTTVTFWDVNPGLLKRAWFEQAEKWMIVQDGSSLPIFWDGAEAKRSVPTLGQMTAGRMMKYHRGRVAKVNPDGVTFSIGDLVYGSSGTAEQKHRDAVLYVQENTYLNGGGFFNVPGNYGEITFMQGMAVLDSALGQGPLQVGTRKAIFSVDLPYDRTTWQNTTNPIQTVSQITNGGTSQDSVVNVNGDLFYRSIDGVRSFVQATRDFFTQWGNTPISREMNRVFPYDDETLLGYSSAALFQNRFMVTASPAYSSSGVFNRGIGVLDFDILSSMRNKAAPAWDGVWAGVNTLKMVTGEDSGKERCMIWVLTGEGEIELWEMRPDLVNDRNDDIPIRWAFETANMFRKGDKFSEVDLKKLLGGELFVQDVVGRVDFRVLFKPDQHPCWIEWHSWYVCAKESECDIDTLTGCRTTKNYKPMYWPRMPFGEPPDDCDTDGTEKPYRLGRSFQVRVEIIGHCTVRAMRLMATLEPEPIHTDMMDACPNQDYDG